jgi:hypothetical protein
LAPAQARLGAVRNWARCEPRADGRHKWHAGRWIRKQRHGRPAPLLFDDVLLQRCRPSRVKEPARRGCFLPCLLFRHARGVAGGVGGDSGCGYPAVVLAEPNFLRCPLIAGRGSSSLSCMTWHPWRRVYGLRKLRLDTEKDRCNKFQDRPASAITLRRRVALFCRKPGLLGAVLCELRCGPIGQFSPSATAAQPDRQRAVAAINRRQHRRLTETCVAQSIRPLMHARPGFSNTLLARCNIIGCDGGNRRRRRLHGPLPPPSPTWKYLCA